MSDTPATPQPAPAPAEKRPAEKGPRRRKWRRRCLRALMVFVLLALALRVALPFLAPWGVATAGSLFGFDAALEDFELSLWRGRVQLRGLEVRPKQDGEEPAEALVQLDLAVAQLDLGALLSGELRVSRVLVDGLRARVARDAEGRWNFLEAIAGLLASDDEEPAEEEPVEEEPDEPPGRFMLQLPVRVDALRLQNVLLEFEDLVQEPPFLALAAVEASVSDVGAPDADAKLTLSLHAPGLVDLMRLDGVVQQGPDAVLADLDVSVSRLRPRPAAPYLALISLEPRAEVISLDLGAQLSLERLADEPSTVRADVTVSDLRSVADGRTTIALGELHAGLERLSMAEVDGLSAALVGLEAGAGLDARGTFVVGGLAIGGAAASAAAPQPQPQPQPAPAPPVGPPSDALTSSGPPAILRILRSLSASDVALTFRDVSRTPAVELVCEVDRALAAREAGLDADGVLPPAEVRLELRAPGLIETLTVDGAGRLFGDDQSLALTVAGEGLTLDRLRPYLTPIGIEPELVAGTIAAEVEAGLAFHAAGGFTCGVEILDVRVEDQGKTLLGVREISVPELEVEPGQALRLREATVAGIDLPLHRTADGLSHFLGLRFDPVQLALAPIEQAREAQSEARDGLADEPDEPDEPKGAITLSIAPPTLPLPVIEVGRLACVDTRLHFRDDALVHPLDVVLEDMGVELSGLRLVADAGAARGPEAAFRVWLGAPGLAESFDVSGSLDVAPGCHEAQLGLVLRAAGIAPELLSEYIAEVDLESRLIDGELSLDLALELAFREEALTAALGLTGVRLSDRGRELLALDALNVLGARVGPGGISVESVSLIGPRATVARDRTGGLHGLGFLSRAVSGGTPAAPEPPTAADAGEDSGEEGSVVADPIDAALAPLMAVPFPITLASFELVDASVEWRDERVWPPVHTRLDAGLALRGLELAPGSAGLALEAEVRAEEAFRSLRVSTSASARPEAIALAGAFELDGLHPGELEVYFPAGARMGMSDGGVRAGFGVGLDANAEGGRSGLLELTGVEVTDENGAQTLLRLGRAALEAGRLDLMAGAIDIAEVALEGLELEATRSADGRSLVLAGITVPLGSGPGAPAASTPKPAPGGGAPSGGDARRSWATFLRERAELPDVWLRALDVGVARLVVHDEARPGSEPIVVSARATTSTQLHLLGPDPSELGPIRISCELGAVPLVDSVALDLELSPFAPDALIDGELRVRGIDAPQILALVPELADQLDGSGLSDGQVDADFQARVSWRRRGPLDFDLRNGFSGEASVQGLELRNGAEERALAGVESILVDLDRVTPRTGAVLVRSIEVERPYGYAQKTADGLRVFGLLVPLASAAASPDAPPPAEPAVADSSPTSAEPAPEQPAKPVESAPPAPTPPRPSSELRIGQFVVSGIDFMVENVTVDPPAQLPLTDLELDVKRFTTLGLVERHPFTVRMRLNAGNIELPVRERAGHLLAGMVGGVTSAFSSSEKEVKREPRPAFDEVALDAVLALAPLPEGRIDLRIRELELLTFAAIAKENKIELQDGLMESKVQVRLEGEEGMRVESRTTFEHLSVSEPAGGPISSVLKLPASLDTVLWVLQDDKGRQVIPLSFTVEAGKISRSQIISKATGAFLRLVTDALASSPMRLGKGLLNFTGIGQLTGITGDGGAPELVGETLEVHYAPAATAAPTREVDELAPKLLEFTKDDGVRLQLTHRFGAADLVRAEELANPAPELVYELGERLRNRKALLLAERTHLARFVSALHSIGRVDQAGASRERIIALDRELASTERGIDVVYAQLAPGAEMRRRRRTKVAALDIARLRLESLRDRLIELSDGKLADRIEIRAPRFREPEGDSGGAVTILARRAK